MSILISYWSAQLDEFPTGWEDMEIEAKWDAFESVFHTMIGSFPDRSEKYGYDLNVRWSGTSRRYTDLYYDVPANHLFDDLHALRHRRRARTSSSIRITDSFSTLKNPTFGFLNRQKM